MVKILTDRPASGESFAADAPRSPLGESAVVVVPDGVVPVDLVLGALADVPLVHLDTQPRAGRSLDEAVVENQRVERGLYVCKECDTVANADVNGAENIRQKVLSSLATDGGDRDSGWLAQPAVHLFDRSEGRFAPREQVANREP